MIGILTSNAFSASWHTNTGTTYEIDCNNPTTAAELHAQNYDVQSWLDNYANNTYNTTLETRAVIDDLLTAAEPKPTTKRKKGRLKGTKNKTKGGKK